MAWTVHTLMRAEVPTTYWTTGGVKSLPVEASELKLDKDWQKRVVDAVGSYGDIYRRTLGEESPYKLPRGLNAAWQDGGLVAAPYSD